MRIAIASRIFAPESAAASFRLEALAEALVEAGHEVTVLTVRPTRRMRAEQHDVDRTYSVKRYPVLRDRAGYVRGYLPYLSFDIPLFFRVLFGPRQDMYVVEPPPTSGFFVRLATAIRRTPYAYYAADVWSDAAEATGALPPVLKVVRSMEKLAVSGAACVLTVSDQMAVRIEELAPGAAISTVGNGADLRVFSAGLPSSTSTPYFIYSGTASEWQGARIFIDAFARISEEFPEVKLVFLGQGSDWDTLKEVAQTLAAGRVEFFDTAPPAQAASWIRGAVASIASLRPDSGYSVAFPTKVYASWACGTPVIYAGDGPVTEFFNTHLGEAELGELSEYTVVAVADAMRKRLRHELSAIERVELSQWAASHVSLQAAAQRAVTALEGSRKRMNK